MPFRGLAFHLPGFHIEGSIERQGPMTVILEAMSFGATRRERQHRIEAIQCLDGSLFVDAEHGRMLRRGSGQSEEIGRFPLPPSVAAGPQPVHRGAVQPARRYEMRSPRTSP